MSRALKSAAIEGVLGGRMITAHRASLSCNAALLIPADYFTVLKIAYTFVTDEVLLVKHS